MSQCKYPGCSFLDDQHRPYSKLRDGVPSVTTIAGSLDVGDKGRAFAWSAALIAANMAVHHSDQWWNLPSHGKDGPCSHMADKNLCLACRFIRSEFDRVWKAKAAKGTHVHHLALSWARGEDIETDPVIEPYMDALEKFYLDCQPEFVHLERTVLGVTADSLRWRGQFDMIAWLTRKGKRRQGLWDLKTGSYHPSEQTLQMVGYRYADWLTDWEGKEEVRTRPMPKVDEAGVLLLGDDGNYQLIELPVTPAAHQVFTNLRMAWEWAKELQAWEKERQAAVTCAD